MEQRPALLAHRHDGKRHEHGDEENLQQIAGDERFEERPRDNVHQEPDRAEGFGLLRVGIDSTRIERLGVDVKSFTGPDDVHHDKADD